MYREERADAGDDVPQVDVEIHLQTVSGASYTEARRSSPRCADNLDGAEGPQRPAPARQILDGGRKRDVGWDRPGCPRSRTSNRKACLKSATVATIASKPCLPVRVWWTMLGDQSVTPSQRRSTRRSGGLGHFNLGLVRSIGTTVGLTDVDLWLWLSKLSADHGKVVH
jgi:hypothetical protein